ncbi:MAG: SRPBCC family protein [Leptospiraceae bacterium]|nr:SRPBCC family protein [Leptospiraceae bacterium]MCP5495702.1 SRPBCC family protein [Leptospiraceae bacterium]
MKIIKKIGVGIIIVLFILVIIGYFLPRKYEMDRSIIINTPVEDVFYLVNNLKNWENWYPWQKGDPTLKVGYEAVIEGKGAFSKWTSLEYGEGSVLITECIPNEFIQTDISFQESKAIGSWNFIQKEKKQTKVVWKFTGDAEYNLIGRYFGLFIDSSLGPYFELGLQRLKKIAEGKETK